MAQRRPIASHPAFAPFLALWFAALFGLAVAVLPNPLLERALSAVGVDALVPLTALGRTVASGGAAILGGALGSAVAVSLARRGLDPRPIYAEPDTPIYDPVAQEPVRRPLRVHEELGDAEFDPRERLHADMRTSDQQVEMPAGAEPDNSDLPAFSAERSPPSLQARQSDDGFMILGSHPAPSPVQPRPEQDIDALLAQFDSALASFRAGAVDRDASSAPSSDRPDPVRAFVARQTNPRAAAVLGGAVIDNQAELRAVLDKLARAREPD